MDNTWPSDGMATAKMPQDNKIIEQLCDALAQEISHAEKSVVSITDRLVGVLREEYPQPTDPQDIKYPGGESPFARKLQEFCQRVEQIGDSVNRLRNRIEL